MSLFVQTPMDIIKLALKQVGVLGVGQTALAEDFNDAFMHLNMMIAQWAKKRYLVYHLVDVVKISTGASSYTIGPAADFDITPRPEKIQAAFARQLVTSPPNQIDFPLRIIQARETYDNIALKSIVSVPEYVFLDTAYPTGVVYIWPCPLASIYEVHLTVKAPIAQFTSLAQHISVPEEYLAAMMFNLAVRLAPAYQQQVDPATVALAKDSLNVIRMANTQIAELQMPDALVQPGTYNPFSDRSN